VAERRWHSQLRVPPIGCGRQYFPDEEFVISEIRLTETEGPDPIAVEQQGDREHRSSWTEIAFAGATATVLVSTLAVMVGTPNFVLAALPEGLRGVFGDNDKVWIFVVWLTTAASALLAILIERARGLGRFRRPVRWVIAVLSTAGLALAVISASWQDPVFGNLWVGFTFTSLGLGVVMSLGLLGMLFRGLGSGRALTALSYVAVSGLALLPLVQIPDTYDNAFTLDEIISQATGRLPGFDYVTQYQSVLGLPLGIVATLFPGAFASRPELFAIGWLIFLQLLTVGLALAALHRIAPARVRWLMPILVVPVIYLLGPAGLAYYADLPMRLVLPTCLLAAIVIVGMFHRQLPAAWWVAVLFGSLGGLSAWNNLDFGVPAFLAGGIAVVAVAPRLWEAIRAGALYLAGGLIFPIIYIVGGTLAGHTFHPSYMLFFVRGFGVGNFNNWDMQQFGLHSGFVFLGVVGVVVGVLGSRRLMGRNRVLHQALLFQSSWLLLSLVYFSGRSLAPTLVTGSAPIAAIVIAMLICAGFPRVHGLVRRGVKHWDRGEWIVALALILLMAIPIAAWTYFPSLQLAKDNLQAAVQSPGLPTYLSPDPRAAMDEIPADTELIGILSTSGAAWSARLGTPNADLFLHPDYYKFFESSTVMQCEYLGTLPGTSLLTTRAVLNDLVESKLCRDTLDINDALTLVEAKSTGETEWLLVDKK